MSTITKFEDLIVAGSSESGEDDLQNDYNRCTGKRFWYASDSSAGSGMTNIAEGFDCVQQLNLRFLGIARRSVVEVQSLLYAALDVDHIKEDTFKIHYEQAKKTKALIGGLKNTAFSRTCVVSLRSLNMDLDTWNMEL